MKRHSTIVIKLGTSSIVHEKTHEPLLSTLALIVETAVQLRRDGHRIVIVSSGAIGVALQRMKKPGRPKHLPQVQALAAIGQCRLMGLWDQLFDRFGQVVAQVLLTRNDIADRTQYQNAQNTFSELLSMGVIPIVNENDTLAVSEIKFGDNDTLSAITAGMVGADYLFLMTDVDCLYDKNPRQHADANPIEIVQNIAELDADISSAGSALGTGGMSTKIVAARLATAAGVTTVITRSSRPGNVASIVQYVEAQKQLERTNNLNMTLMNGSLDPVHLNGAPLINAHLPVLPPPLHTRFLPSQQRIRDRPFWVLHGLAPHGTVYIDRGAARALADKAGLLPVGVVDVDGTFAQQECVRLVEVQRREARPRSYFGGNHHSRGPSTSQSPATSNTASSSTTGAITTTTTPSSSSITPTGTHSASISNSHSGNETPPASAQPLAPHTPLPTTANLAETADTAGFTPREIGRAIVNYSATEIRRIKGLQSTEIVAVLGYADSEYVAVRENVALTLALSQGSTATVAAAAAAGSSRGQASWAATPATSMSSTEQISSPKSAVRVLGVSGGLGSYVQ